MTGFTNGLLGPMTTTSQQKSYARTNIGLGTTDSPTFDSLFIGGSDAKISRGATGPTIDLQAAGGIRSRNLAGNADAPISGSNGTFSGTMNVTGNITGNGDATIGTSGNRQISLSSGNGIVSIKGAATGGYAHQFGFTGNLGTALGGYGMVGSGDALTNFWIGASNSNPYMTLTSALVAMIPTIATVGASVDRQISLKANNGSTLIKGAATGGWAHFYGFQGNAGTILGGFGMLGSGDATTNFWIGPAYDSAYATLSSTGTVFPKTISAGSTGTSGSLTLVSGTSNVATGIICIPSWDTNAVAIRNAFLSDTAANTALYQDNGGGTRLNTAAGQSLVFRVGNVTAGFFDSSQAFTISDSFMVGTATTNAPLIFPFDVSAYTSKTVAGRGLSFYSKVNVADGTGFAFTGNSFTQTTGQNVGVRLAIGFSPTSGTGQFTSVQIQPTINQTGGANGVTRSLYVVPSLTAAASHIGIEVGNVGSSHVALKTGTGLVQLGDSTTISKAITGTFTALTLTNNFGSANDITSLFFTNGGGSGGTINYERQGVNSGDFVVYTSPTFSGTLTERFRIAAGGAITAGNDITTSGIFNSTSSAASTFGVSRKVSLNGNSGFVSIAASTGGWSTDLRFIGSGGTNFGGFGATGTNDTLSYHWIGASFSNPNIVSYQDGRVGVGLGLTIPLSPLHIANSNSAANSQPSMVRMVHTYNQSGTAGSTDLLINRSETAIGSGSHYFIDGQVGGVTKWNVSKFGTVTQSGSIVFPGTAVTRTIQVGDTYGDGSELQVLNGVTTIARFNSSTGFITGLNVQATGALFAGGATSATFGAGYNLGLFGSAAVQSQSSTNGNIILNIVQGVSVTGGTQLIRAYGNSTGSSEIYVQNVGTGQAKFFANAVGTGDAQSQWGVNGGTIWSAGLDQSDSSAWVLSKSAALGSSNVLRVDATSLSMSLYDGLSFATVAKGITYKSGTGARAGNAILVAGTVTVANTSVTANTIVIYCVKTLGGTPGNLSYTLSAGVSFTINSDNPLDTSTISYQLIELV